MKRWAEFTGFLALAAGAHLLIFAEFPAVEDGQDAGGIGGQAVVTLRGAPASMAEVIEDWTRPPEVTLIDLMVPLHVAEAPNAKFRVAATITVPPKVEQPPRMHDPLAEATPQVETAPPPKPVPKPVVKKPPEPKPKPKPKAKPKPQEKAKPSTRNTAASSGQDVQKAAGAGGSAQAGASGKADVKTLSKGKEAKLRSIWGAKIRTRVERRKRSVSGKAKGRVAKVSITVSNSGQLLGVSLAKSSGMDKVDQEALAAVKRAGKFPKAPKGMNRPSYTLQLPIRF